MERTVDCRLLDLALARVDTYVQCNLHRTLSSAGFAVLSAYRAMNSHFGRLLQLGHCACRRIPCSYTDLSVCANIVAAYLIANQKAMKIEGSCHCGAIIYEAELDPESVGICHCADCQKLSSSAFRTYGAVQAGDFRLLEGNPKIYLKTGDSGNRREQAFCENCGSGLYSASPGDEPKAHNIRMGTVAQRDQLPPQLQLWCRSAQSWLPDIETPKKLDKQ